ncbi:GRB2-associated-binding protein 2-like isoform X1 [Marmota marmota marmota]|uniref:GRB2-associated-binding protein 2-like isoform X1 n=1 Tax=Marmota marmota marmota TaxID=9994 RepID=UPI002092EDEF|nr:GRB2-associated-binding protein 2-like isoform X1 [Marmota marmota marmota]
MPHGAIPVSRRDSQTLCAWAQCVRSEKCAGGSGLVSSGGLVRPRVTGGHGECPCRTICGHVGLISSVTASFPEACNHSPWGTERAGTSAESRSLGASFHQPAGVDVSHLNKASSEDDYLPMSTVFSTLQDMEGAGGNSQNVHNRRNPRNLQFGSHNCPPEALSLHKGQVRGSHIQPPVVNRSLKPGWQGDDFMTWVVLSAFVHLEIRES